MLVSPWYVLPVRAALSSGAAALLVCLLIAVMSFFGADSRAYT